MKQTGCKVKLDDMIPIQGSRNKYCASCSQEIYDIRNLSNQEIAKLKLNNAKKFCVIANLKQMENRKHKLSMVKYSRLRKFGVMSSLLLGFFFNNDIHAQNKEYKVKYKTELLETKSNRVLIKGKVVKKNKLGIRVGIKCHLTIHNQDGIMIKQFSTANNGEFTIEFPKGIIGDNYSIICKSIGFKTVTIDNWLAEDAMLKILMENPLVHVGYY